MVALRVFVLTIVFYILITIANAVYYLIKFRNVVKDHRLELELAEQRAWKAAQKEWSNKVGMVQHCNSRTDYEFIKHIYNPDGCVHCKEIEDLIREMDL